MKNKLMNISKFPLFTNYNVFTFLRNFSYIDSVKIKERLT